MSSTVDDLAGAALVKVLDAADELHGTGFVIDHEGSVLTCHHVVDGLSTVRLEAADGTRVDVSADACVTAAGCDLALVPAGIPFGTPLPVAPRVAAALSRFWTKGFHRIGETIGSAFPAEGASIGTATVRYVSATTEYEIRGALVLRDDAFAPGLSGAPVLDPDAGVVIGVASTMLFDPLRAGGFAVRLSVDRAPEPLREALARNADTVPAFGGHLNRAGLREICAQRNARALQELTVLRRVDLSQRVSRGEIEAQLAKLVDDGPPVVALVGPSGVGKTTELARFAAETGRPALLLRGSSVDAGAPHVGAAVAAALSAGATSARDLARVAAAEGGLRVLLDGLNEMPEGVPVEEFIVGTLNWLRDSSARLFVACRPELWSRVAAVLDPIRPTAVAVVPIGEFTDDEMREASARYGVLPAADTAALRVPVMVRLYAEAAGTGAATVNGVIEAYVTAAAGRVAAAIGTAASAYSVLDWLSQAAGRMYAADDDVLDPTTFHTIFPAALLAGDRVIGEHLLSRTPRGYRFVYDDVGDWLKAAHVDLDRELHPEALRRLGSGGTWRRVGPIGYALRELARRDGPDALIRRLMPVHLDFGAAELFEETLRKVADAEPYRALLQTLVHKLHRADRRVSAAIAPDFWAALALPVADRLDLLRQFVPTDNDWGWRSKDWAEVPVSSRQYNYAPAALYLVARNPADGFAGLVPWLTDPTRLTEDEATVADVAMGILYRLRRADPDALWAAMTSAGSPAALLVTALARDDPALLTDLVVRHGAAATDAWLPLRAAQQLNPDTLPAADRAAVLDVIRTHAARDLEPDARGAALGLLARYGGGEDAVRALAEAYVRGQPNVGAYALAGAAAEVPAVLLDALDRVVRAGPDRRDEALGALAYAAKSYPQVSAAADALMLGWLSGGVLEVNFSVARYVEDRLWAAGRLDDGLAALARLVISAPPGSGRNVLAYPLTSPSALRTDPSARHRLATELLDAHDDPDTGDLVLQKIVDREGRDPLREELAAHVVARLGSAADGKLVWHAYWAEGFAPVLVQWIEDGLFAPPGELIEQWYRLVRAGTDPQEAAGRIIRGQRS